MSLSLDMGVLFDNASTIVNALWPILGITAGFTLGFGVLGLVLGAIVKAVRARM